MFDMRGKGIESNVVFKVGTICRSALANIIHLVAMKSIEGAVSGFLQNRSTSLSRVMRYSQIDRADFAVSACHVHSHVAWSPTWGSILQLKTQRTMTQREHRQQIP